LYKFVNDCLTMSSKEDNKSEDKLLLLKLKEGNRHAYHTLYERYWEQTYNNAYKRLKDHGQAEDITQDIFLQLWHKREELNIVNLGAYLFTATKNNVFKWMGKQEKFVPISELLIQLESAFDSPDAKILKMEFAKAYEALVNSLTESQQSIFRMRYQEDLTPAEIASKLDISPKTVRNQLGLALAKLKASLMLLLLIAASVKR
jgi:RNA polymerase sigma-70 factor (family 1)